MVKMKLMMKPEPKGRPRVGRHGVYTPGKTRASESELALKARLALGPNRPPFCGPLAVEVMVGILPPKSKSVDHYPAVRPDIDNYGKLVCDGLNGILWNDDGQICELKLTKVYSKEEFIEISCRMLP